MIVTNFVDASNYLHISNEFSMFSYCCCCISFSLTSKKFNASLATWCAPRRSRSRNIAVRNVFRSLVREQHLLVLLMFKICYVFPHYLRSCPPDHNVRSFPCASLLRSLPPLGRHGGCLGRQAPPQISGRARLVQIWAATAAMEHIEGARCFP